MMRSSIENLKQNLDRFALDVHGADVEELEIYGSPPPPNGHDSSVSDRRNSHSFAHSKSFSPSPLANGIEDSHFNSEIVHYKAEIKRLKESEAEIKALAVNYSALLKEKEDHISRLNQENGSLKKNLDATKEALNTSKNENTRASTHMGNVLKGNGDQSPKRQLKSSATQVKNRYVGNQTQNGLFSKQDGVGNGVAHTFQPDVIPSKMESRNSDSQGKEKELADLLEEKHRSLTALQATHELQLKRLKMELEQERDKLANMQLKLQEEHRLKESFRKDLQMLKMEENKTSIEMSKMRTELNTKTSEIKRLQMELSRMEDEDADNIVNGLRRVIAALEKENTDLKIANNELEAALEMNRKSLTDTNSPDGKADSSTIAHIKEELELSMQKMERDLKETRREKDKALQELARLKQHLLEKESEESEKMDEDSKIIEELREHNEYLKAQVLHREKALKQATASQEEMKTINKNEIQNSKEMVEDLNRKLANCMSIIDSKNEELLNLQTALGQYFAEIEAKEHLEQQLALAREELANFSELLKDAKQGTEVSRKEKEDILAQLAQKERMLAEGKNRVNKLEEDNAKLRRALDQSMTRLNRMSVDSDYLVDRRIVIKLLVTYFQRNHSKEVLDLMVRMLGFSDEDKQRIGVAQQGGRGVVRGVLGFPGRLVGGILGGSSGDAPTSATSENQSFADLWVDFLLKETEERGRRESAEDAGRTNEDSQARSPNAAGVSPPLANHRTSASNISGFARSKFSPMQNYGPPLSQGNFKPLEHSDSEFSTVPLTSMDSTSHISRLIPKH